jgi:hypothetical protein
MARARYHLTPALQEKIVSYVRAGGFAHVAAEAAGLPRAVFARWMRLGERADAPELYQRFTRAIREAEAQSRLQAEVSVRGDKPLDWLKAGPGKTGPDNPGWGNPGRTGEAASPTAAKSERERVLSEILQLFGRCAEQLAAFPDARTALSAWLASLPEVEKRGDKEENGTS